jgi:hypothetical protein
MNIVKVKIKKEVLKEKNDMFENNFIHTALKERFLNSIFKQLVLN